MRVSVRAWSRDAFVSGFAYLAEQTVMPLADRAAEAVDRVLVLAPAAAVGTGAVVAALAAGLCHGESALEPALILLARH